MQAIVLSRRDFRESDQIISLYTKEKGKLELLARGVKKITSKNSAHLEPFSLVDIDIAYGKELNHLTKVQPIEYFKNIRKDLEKSLSASYIVSITDKFIHSDEEDERIFVFIKSWMEYVNTQSSILNLKSLLDGYMAKLLHCLGFSMSQSPKSGRWISQLEVMESGNWEAINELEYSSELHRQIYQFLVYQTEKKVLDWAKLA